MSYPQYQLGEPKCQLLRMIIWAKPYTIQWMGNTIHDLARNDFWMPKIFNLGNIKENAFQRWKSYLRGPFKYEHTDYS